MLLMQGMCKLSFKPILEGIISSYPGIILDLMLAWDPKKVGGCSKSNEVENSKYFARETNYC